MKRLFFLSWILFLILDPKLGYALFVQGPNKPGTIGESSLAGSSQGWQNTSNAGNSDDLYSESADSLATGEYTDHLVASNFGFSLPANAVVLGIQVLVELRRSGGNLDLYQSRLQYGGLVGTTDVIGDTLLPNPVDLIQSHGSLFQTWGESWTGGTINSPTFGYVLAIQNNSGDAKSYTAFVDNIMVLVYYQIPLGVHHDWNLTSLWEDGIPHIHGTLPHSGTLIYLERSINQGEFQEVKLGWTIQNQGVKFQLKDALVGVDPTNVALLQYRLRATSEQGEDWLSETVELSPSITSKPELAASLVHHQGSRTHTLKVSNIGEGRISVQVLNLDGRTIYQGSYRPFIGQKELPLSHLPSGTYLLLVQQQGARKTFRFFHS